MTIPEPLGATDVPVVATGELSVEAGPDVSGGSVEWGTRSVVRVEGVRVGSGFVVGADVVATCAHLLEGPEAVAWVQFPQLPDRPRVRAVTVPGSWRDPDLEDVVILRAEGLPVAATPLRLRPSIPAEGRDVVSFGFPAESLSDGHWGTCRTGRQVRDQGVLYLQLTKANDLAQGFSGAPLVDRDGLVVGMVVSHPGRNLHDRGRNIAYAAPASTLLAIHPELAGQQQCPYPGLRPFTTAEHHWFHGRRDQITALRNHLATTRGITVLLGPSGSGKTSLIHAGLLPDLNDHPLPTRPGTARPDGAPVEVLRPSSDLATLPEKITALVSGPGLLMIDQFEELLTTPTNTPDGDRPAPLVRDTIEALKDAARRDCAGRVVLVVRDDFYPHLARTGLLATLGDTRRLVNVPDTLARAQAEEVIREPAQYQGWDVDPVLVERLLNEVTDPDGVIPVAYLPLLALTLERTWHTATTHTPPETGAATARLDSRHHESAGGLAQAVTLHCDQALTSLHDTRLALARRVLTSLVTDVAPGPSAGRIRRQLTREHLAHHTSDPCELDAVVDHLVTARVLTTHTTEDTATRIRRAWVELAHDAIVEHWQTLRDWLDEDHAYRTWLTDTDRKATTWIHTSNDGPSRRDPELLLRGTQLDQAVTRRTSAPLPPHIDAYLDASAQAATVSDPGFG